MGTSLFFSFLGFKGWVLNWKKLAAAHEIPAAQGEEDNSRITHQVYAEKGSVRTSRGKRQQSNIYIYVLHIQ